MVCVWMGDWSIQWIVLWLEKCCINENPFTTFLYNWPSSQCVKPCLTDESCQEDESLNLSSGAISRSKFPLNQSNICICWRWIGSTWSVQLIHIIHWGSLWSWCSKSEWPQPCYTCLHMNITDTTAHTSVFSCFISSCTAACIYFHLTPSHVMLICEKRCVWALIGLIQQMIR